MPAGFSRFISGRVTMSTWATAAQGRPGKVSSAQPQPIHERIFKEGIWRETTAPPGGRFQTRRALEFLKVVSSLAGWKTLTKGTLLPGGNARFGAKISPREQRIEAKILKRAQVFFEGLKSEKMSSILEWKIFEKSWKTRTNKCSFANFMGN